MGEISKFTQRRIDRINYHTHEYLRYMGLLPMYGNVYKTQVLAEQVLAD